MTSELIQTVELAVDSHGNSFDPEPHMCSWKVQRVTGGRPANVMRNKQPVTVPRNASYEMIRRILNIPGLYRLVQLDEYGNEIDGTIAYIYIEPDDYSLSPQQERALSFDRLMELCEQMSTQLAETTKHNLSIMGEMNRELLNTNVQLFQGASEVISSANSTTMVANGLDAIEREDPQVDVEELSERLTEALDLGRDSDRNKTPWFVQLLNGPIGVAAMQFLGNFSKSMAAAALTKEK